MSHANVHSTTPRLTADLGTTQVQIQTAKWQLTETLVTIEHQKSGDSSNTTLTDIQQQQAIVTDQLPRLQQALGGQRPITRDDLDRSQHLGWIQGIVTSLTAAFLFAVGRRAWSWSRST